ncbi:MAG TPA: hypothetical protein VD907_07070 [Verrucomicrobiae bacterium]|nr:hypothetical protein [Verrucomicrobiae bacterium]
MTIEQAKKLQWGARLKPTPHQRSTFKRRAMVDGIFLGLDREKRAIKVVKQGCTTPEAWAPVFWRPKIEVI